MKLSVIDIIVRRGAPYGQEPEPVEPQLAAIAREIQEAANAAWADADRWANGRAAIMTQAARDEEAAYHRGRAHAYCDVLGDQTMLGQLLEEIDAGERPRRTPL